MNSNRGGTVGVSEKRLEQLSCQSGAEQHNWNRDGIARATSEQSHAGQQCPKDETNSRARQFGNVVGPFPVERQVREAVQGNGIVRRGSRNKRSDRPRYSETN